MGGKRGADARPNPPRYGEALQELTMNIQIHARNIPLTRAVHDLAIRRLGYALGRFAHLIGNISLRLSDTNGPKGGVDVEALALVELRQGTRLVVRGAYASPQEAVSAIVERVRHNVQRCHDRLAKTHTLA
jgi:ribosome-associated translation inhibitor RaiA